jgi:YbgC/YbaW family acyl-CoA thioester hydrolase
VPVDGKPAGSGVSTWFDGNWFVHRFTATYQDTNSVGNVYFAQYMMWVGKTRELFFNTVLPEFDLKKTDFFILTRSFEHKYLREAREFETIEVRVKISDYNRKFSTLAHRVFNGDGQELGRGTQTLMFVSATDYRLINIPDVCMRAFLNYVG